MSYASYSVFVDAVCKELSTIESGRNRDEARAVRDLLQSTWPEGDQLELTVHGLTAIADRMTSKSKHEGSRYILEHIIPTLQNPVSVPAA